MYGKGMLPLALGLWLAAPPAGAQTHPVLDSLVALALERNPEIKAADAFLQAADYKAKTAGVWPDPRLSLGALNLPRRSPGFSKTEMSGFMIGLMQEVPWPGRLSTEKGLARLETEMAGRNRDGRRNALTRMVREEYYEYAYWTLAGDLLDENLGLLQAISAAAQTRYASGQVSAQDFLRAQMELIEMENRRDEAALKRLSSRWLLNRLIDAPIYDSAALPASLPEVAVSGPPDTAAVSLENSPLLARAALMRQAAEKEVHLTKSEYWPDLMLGVDYEIRKNLEMDPMHGEDFLSFRAEIRLPLWFFARQKNHIRSAKENLNAAREDERAVELTLRQEAADAVISLETIRRNLSRIEGRLLPQAQAAFRAAQAAYEVGQIDFETLLGTLTAWLDGRLERLELTRDYHQKLADLRELAGNGIESEVIE